MMDIKKSVDDSGKCIFMRLPKCLKQDTSKRLDMSVCDACISGRMERHLFNIKESIDKLVIMFEAKFLQK